MGETESETVKNKEKRKKKDKKGGRSSGVVRWERFLKRMNLRVLLVEADDCTRQIIAALLRKCSYRGQYMSFLPFTSARVGLFACFLDSVGFCSLVCRIVNWVLVGFGFCGKILVLKSKLKGSDRGRK
jgi:hypothetical protein